jgi:hypothetical protein
MDSCDDKLTLTKEPYTGSQMKIEGYYYRKNAIYCTSVYFLYRDGTFIDAGCFSCKPDEIENHVKNKDWTQWRRYEKSAIGYGVFQISGSQILIENWRPSSSWSLPAYLYKGEILNDTTFVITQSQRSKPNALDNDFSAKHEIYRFRHFSSKPDSTNRFTK